MFERDIFSSFSLNNIKSLGGISMWSGSKKKYVLNQSCVELFRDPTLYQTPSKHKENPFWFSIPASYFNFDFGKGKEFL